ncbi:MAG: hypothetical protein JXN65_07215 [Clostridia bacterium]|nr:hypothetical protein [Clostridia bacterium]
MYFGSDIKRTIYISLFENNENINYRKEFDLLKDRIFPNINLFKNFLMCTQNQERFELAKRIVQQLSLESNFTPSYEYYKILFRAEQKDNFNDKYIGKDHFIHIVHLYLFGIYVFFYNKKLSSRIINQLSYSRTNQMGSTVLDSIRDFVRCWKYFVLYHDIGYIAELNDSASIDLFEKMKVKIGTSLNMQTRIDVISRLFVIVSKVFEKNRNYSDNLYEMRKYNDSLNNGFRFGEEILNSMKDYWLLEDVNDLSDLKYFLLVYSKNDFCILYRRKYSREILAAYYKYDGIIGDKKDKVKFIINEGALSDVSDKDNKLLYELKQNPEIVISNKYYSFDNIEMLFYVVEPKDKLDKYLIQNFNSEYFIARIKNESIIEYFYENVSFLVNECSKGNELSSIDDSLSVKNLYMNIYKYVYEFLMSLDNREEKLYLEVLEKSIDDISSDLLSQVLKETENINYEEEDSSYSNINNVITMFSNKMFKKLDLVLRDEAKKKSIIKYLYFKHGNIVNMRDFIFESYRSFKTKELNLNFDGEGNNLYSSPLSFESFFDDLDKSFKSTKHKNNIELFRCRFEESYMNILISCGIRKENISYNIIESYKNPHSKYDHSLISTEILLTHIKYYFWLLKSFDRNSINLFNEQMSSVSEIIEKYSATLHHVILAVIMHNIYPGNFEKIDREVDYLNSKLINCRISLTNSPFIYFACLCDSLQTWDRPYCKNPAFNRLDETKSFLNNFSNIKIENDEIIIKLTGYSNNDIKKAVDMFSLGLDSYLKNASLVVKFDTSSSSNI